ncbi:MAG TPA: hypothetical protein VJ846_03465 [Sphingomicrobium sp.]|nr:hypothetical protein [Sphingomicrobium sp.]
MDLAQLATQIQAWLNNASALATVLGFGALGVFVALRYSLGRTLAFIWRKVERRRLGGNYDTWRALATEDGTFDPKKSIRLIPVLKNKVEQASQAIRKVANERLSRRLRRLASGSTRLTNQDLLSDPALLLPISFGRNEGEEHLSLEQLLTQLFDASVEPSVGEPQNAQPRLKVLLLGAAGLGKSMTCLALEAAIQRARFGNAKWALLVTAQDFGRVGPSPSEGSADRVGDEDWCLELLLARLAWASPSELSRRAVLRELLDNSICIIDGLDEIASRIGKAAFEQFLHSWLADRAVVMTARTSFFHAALQGHPAVKGHLRLSLCPPPLEARHAFIQSVCEKIYPAAAAARVSTLERLLAQYPNIETISETPLLLMMLTEIESFDEWMLARVDGVRVYEEFVRQVLDREAARLGDLVPDDQLRAIYQDMAWTLFKGWHGTEVRVGITTAELWSLVATRIGSSNDVEMNAFVEAFLASPLINVTGSDGFRRLALRIAFSHESFAEFLVAQWSFSWMSGDSERGGEFFSYLENPGVSAFLKEYLERTRFNDALQRAIALRLSEQLTKRLEAEKASSDEALARNRVFAAGQMAYYLGMVNDDAGKSLLGRLTAPGNDFWVRRAACIGLAFGGDRAPLDQLINEMRAQVQEDDYTLARKSIAIDLSFYGDQEFDPNDATNDLGGESCQRLVTQQCRELCFDAEAANRRNCLFNLVYLYRHRPLSKPSFIAAMQESGPMIWDALLEMRSSQSPDPEVAEVIEIMETLDIPRRQR